MWRDAMVYEHAAPRCTGLTKMPPPSPPLLLMPFAYLEEEKKAFPYVMNVK